jgi:hypothetical protein
MKTYYVVKDENQAGKMIAVLKNKGYQRTSNCFWFEEWKKGDDIWIIERDF